MLEWIDVFVALTVALLLRFGVPLGLTGVLIWWLRKLDLRWQAEAEETRHVQLAAATAQLAHCWEVRGCTPEMRASCPAYQRNDLPCWQVMRLATGRLPERCFDCKVFRDAPAPNLKLRPAH